MSLAQQCTRGILFIGGLSLLKLCDSQLSEPRDYGQQKNRRGLVSAANCKKHQQRYPDSVSDLLKRSHRVSSADADAQRPRATPVWPLINRSPHMSSSTMPEIAATSSRPGLIDIYSPRKRRVASTVPLNFAQYRGNQSLGHDLPRQRRQAKKATSFRNSQF